MTWDAGMPVAFHLAQQGLRVTGVDTSPTLLTLCHQRMPEHEWIVAEMQTLALPQRFDGLLSWDSLFHLTPTHQRTMFPVFAAHAAPGAFLLFNTGPEQGESLGTYQGEPLYHASLDPEAYQQLLDQSGFALVAHTVEDPTAGGRTGSLDIEGDRDDPVPLKSCSPFSILAGNVHDSAIYPLFHHVSRKDFAVLLR